MYAEIPAAEADRLSPLLEVGKIYTLSRFRICNSKDYFKSVPGPLMLELTCHTKISPSDHGGPFPEYVYTLTPFENIRDYIGDRRKFHDALGVLVEVAEPVWVHFSNEPKPKLRRNIVIKDQSFCDQPIQIRRVGVPIPKEPQPPAQTTMELMTLREMQEKDPYEFPRGVIAIPKNRIKSLPLLLALASKRFSLTILLIKGKVAAPTAVRKMSCPRNTI
ncbi:hypothetical protein C2845_PM07G05540 [Panicum miliaceum]|uniref:Uncharacterized protein n=1 Tax=Panicum miliaceum TaxID=4540 RepID=A0A3L6SP12_PANMI|nr:hypothetical protein C2845_PM07G05540 [Panicum miliaceum]